MYSFKTTKFDAVVKPSDIYPSAEKVAEALGDLVIVGFRPVQAGESFIDVRGDRVFRNGAGSSGYGTRAYPGIFPKSYEETPYFIIQAVPLKAVSYAWWS